MGKPLNCINLLVKKKNIFFLDLTFTTEAFLEELGYFLKKMPKVSSSSFLSNFVLTYLGITSMEVGEVYARGL